MKRDRKKVAVIVEYTFDVKFMLGGEMDNLQKKLISIGVPIALQHLISGSINLLDTFMIGQLGPVEIAGVGIANQIYFILLLLTFGISSSSGIFFSQYYGKKDYKKLHSVLGLTLMLAMTGGIIFLLLGQTIPEKLISLFTKEKEIIKVGGSYLKIASLSYIFMTVSFVYSYALKSIGKPRLCFTSSILSLVINASLNYILIFGKFGLPAMGVKGAAIGTVIARAVETFYYIFFVYKDKYPLASKLGELIDIEKEFVKKYLRTCAPVILTEFFWGVGVTFYTGIFGRMGVKEVAAFNIILVIEEVTYSSFSGLGSSALALVGKSIGEEKEEKAKEIALKISNISFLAGLVTGILLAVFSVMIANIYNIDVQTKKMVIVMMLVFSAILPFRGGGTVNSVGSLRAGGDTKYSMYMEFITMWLIAIPLSLVSTFVFKMPFWVVFFFARIDMLIKFIVSRRRIGTNHWIKNLVKS